MFKSLIEIYNKNNYDIKNINKYNYLQDFIIQLYNNNYNDFIDDFIRDSNKLLWLGNYYKSNKNYELMKKYYLLSIELNNVEAINNLAHYYENIEKNYEQMKIYYLMAINLGNSADAIFNLGNYFKHIEKDYEQMKIYYLLLIEHNDKNLSAIAINNLAHYYENIEKNYDLAKKYYLLSIEMNNSSAMYNLGYYYKTIEINHELMKKYYIMAINLNNRSCIYHCKKNNYFLDNDIKYAINKLNFKIINKLITCPISLEETNKCFITKCNHEFSELIVNCNNCPLCRQELT